VYSTGAGGVHAVINSGICMAILGIGTDLLFATSE